MTCTFREDPVEDVQKLASSRRDRSRFGRSGLHSGLHRAGRSRAGSAEPRHPCLARPIPGRRTRSRCRFRRAGGREGRHQRNGHRTQPRGIYASRRSVWAKRGIPHPGPIRRVHPPERHERHHRPLQHPRFGDRRRHHGTSRRDRERRREEDDDAHLAVLLAVQPVPVHERPERRPAAPRLVDHRVRMRPERHDTGSGDLEAVPPDALLRRAATAPRAYVQGGRQDPPDRALGLACRDHHHRPARLAAGRRRARAGSRVERARLRRRPVRQARLGERVRQGDRVR
jgi:hypothetical protein